MKKIVTIIAIAAASFSSFGQGYFAVTGASKSVWDIFTVPGISKLGATESVAIYIGSGTPGVAGATGIASGVSTNAPTTYNVNPWTSILADSSFHIATNANTLAPLIVPLTTAGGGFTIAGTSPIQGSVVGANTLWVVAWSGGWATPTLAAANNAAVGWSSTFTYNAVDSIGTPPSFATSGFTGFGVNVLAVPEPSTLVLAGLGGLSLLAFRRKK